MVFPSGHHTRACERTFFSEGHFGCLKQRHQGGLPSWSSKTSFQLQYVLSEVNQSETVLSFLLHPSRKINTCILKELTLSVGCLASNLPPPLPISPHLSKGHHLFVELLLPSLIAKLQGQCFYNWTSAKTTSVSKPLNWVPIANFTAA